MDPMLQNQMFREMMATWEQFFNAYYKKDDAQGEKTNVHAKGKAAPVTPAPAETTTVAPPAKDPAPVDTTTTAAPPPAGGEAAEIGNLLADIMIETSHGGIDNDSFVEKLAEKGITARQVESGDKPAYEILDKAGNVVARMADDNGDGSVGFEDESAVEALKALGTDTTKMQQALEARTKHFEGGENAGNADIARKNFQAAGL
jgi:hypothetical protein